MAGLLGAFTNLIGGRAWSDLPASFTISIGEKVELPFPSIFGFYQGTDTSSANRFDCFRVATQAEYQFLYMTRNSRVRQAREESATARNYVIRIELARNYLRSIRAVRHPYVLRVLQGIEVNSGIYIVTEPVQPLILSELPTDPVWGIFQIASAIDFLNESCKSIHGAVSPFSIFVTINEAHWRLGTFDLYRPITGSSSTSQLHPLRGAGFLPPSLSENSIAVDRWGLASLTAWAYAAVLQKSTDISRVSISPEANIKDIPQKAKKLVKVFLKASEHRNKTVKLKDVLETEDIFKESSIIKVMRFFEEINLKSTWDKESFFSTLPKELQSISSQIQCLQILPQLEQQLEFYSKPALLLPSVLSIASTLLEREEVDRSTKEDIYRMHILPVIIKLFKCPDRAIRYALLENLSVIGFYLTTEDVAEIFECICLGFSDSSAILREATLKSMIYFVPKTETSHLNKAIERMAWMLKEDPEGAIRTNAAICFAKLAVPICKTPHGTKVLIGSLSRGLRDSFAPCRLGCLQSLASVCGNFSAVDIINRLIPVVVLRCADDDPRVRESAFHATSHLLESAKTQLSEPCQDRGEEEKATWAGWALRRAVDFYSKSEAEAPEMQPSGRFRTPSPPPQAKLENSEDLIEETEEAEISSSDVSREDNFINDHDVAAVQSSAGSFPNDQITTNEFLTSSNFKSPKLLKVEEPSKIISWPAARNTSTTTTNLEKRQGVKALDAPDDFWKSAEVSETSSKGSEALQFILAARKKKISSGN